jgi:hypothetical protein
MILECMERGTRRHYIVEVKHWVSGKAVPGGQLRKFLNVIVNEKRDSGLFLSTSGFARNAGAAVGISQSLPPQYKPSHVQIRQQRR